MFASTPHTLQGFTKEGAVHRSMGQGLREPLKDVPLSTAFPPACFWHIPSPPRNTPLQGTCCQILEPLS